MCTCSNSRLTGIGLTLFYNNFVKLNAITDDKNNHSYDIQKSCICSKYCNESVQPLWQHHALGFGATWPTRYTLSYKCPTNSSLMPATARRVFLMNSRFDILFLMCGLVRSTDSIISEKQIT